MPHRPPAVECTAALDAENTHLLYRQRALRGALALLVSGPSVGPDSSAFEAMGGLVALGVSQHSVNRPWSTETEKSAVLSTRYGRPAALQMLAMPRGIAALCALQCIPSRVALTANFSVSVD